MDSLVANLSTDLKEANDYTDEEIAFALYKDNLAGWGYLNSMEVDIKQKKQTSQELWMLSSVTLNCQVTKIVMNPGSQLYEL